ncbi:6205_t:CDS:2, partial [Scutellospora calospora]
AIVRGAVAYGLNMGIVESRVLKWTYGVEIKSDYDIRNDPSSLRVAVFHVYITKSLRPKYIGEDGMKLLGTLRIELSNAPTLGRERPVEFALTFGTMEIKATAKNKLTQEVYNTTFELDVQRS